MGTKRRLSKRNGQPARRPIALESQVLRERMLEILSDLDFAGQTLAAARLSSAIDALEEGADAP